MDRSLTLFTQGSQTITLSIQQGLQPKSKAKDSETRVPGVRFHSSGLPPFLTAYDSQPRTGNAQNTSLQSNCILQQCFSNVPKDNHHLECVQ